MSSSAWSGLISITALTTSIQNPTIPKRYVTEPPQLLHTPVPQPAGRHNGPGYQRQTWASHVTRSAVRAVLEAVALRQQDLFDAAKLLGLATWTRRL